jgi:molybdenum cofactor cytidylyltransferase
VRSRAEETARALAPEGCAVAVCERAAERMGATLACGARSARAAAGYMVAPADMPFRPRSIIARVLDGRLRGALLAAPYWRARRGHPVAFAGRLRGELEALAGDEGARRVLDAHAAALVKVPVGDPGVLRDIDQPSDLAPPLAV